MLPINMYWSLATLFLNYCQWAIVHIFLASLLLKGNYHSYSILSWCSIKSKTLCATCPLSSPDYRSEDRGKVARTDGRVWRSRQKWSAHEGHMTQQSQSHFSTDGRTVSGVRSPFAVGLLCWEKVTAKMSAIFPVTGRKQWLRESLHLIGTKWVPWEEEKCTWYWKVLRQQLQEWIVL